MKEYIEREALIARYDAEHVGPPGRARELMVTAPAADVVEVRHAKWDDNHKCTACGNEALLEEKPDTMAHGLNSLFFVDSDYCPHCGALMDKEE